MLPISGDYQLQDGSLVRRLHRLKCQACDTRFFDDDALGRIEAERAKRGIVRA